MHQFAETLGVKTSIDVLAAAFPPGIMRLDAVSIVLLNDSILNRSWYIENADFSRPGLPETEMSPADKKLISRMHEAAVACILARFVPILCVRNVNILLTGDVEVQADRVLLQPDDRQYPREANIVFVIER